MVELVTWSCDGWSCGAKLTSKVSIDCHNTMVGYQIAHQFLAPLVRWRDRGFGVRSVGNHCRREQICLSGVARDFVAQPGYSDQIWCPGHINLTIGIQLHAAERW